MRMLTRFLVFGLLLAATAYLGAQTKKGKAPDKKETAAASGNAAKGNAMYQEFCGVCHYSANAAKKIGPGLKGLYKRGKFADGKKVDDAAMREWIVKGGADMPSFEGQMSEQQMRDLISYLKTL